MLTDAELIREAHKLLLHCLKQDIDPGACVVELTGLFEENGHPFIAGSSYPANEG